MKIKIALIIILFICPLVTSQEIYKENDLFSTKKIKSEVAVPAKSKLEIISSESLQGKINILTTKENIVTAIYIKKAKTDNRTSAIDIIDLIGVSLEITNKGVRLKLRAPNPAPWNSQKESALLNIDLIVPENYLLEIDAPYFDILAAGPFTEFVVPTSLGRLEITNVTEYLELNTSNRKVIISDISGEINISTKNSMVTGNNINSKEKRVTIYNDGGDIQLKDIKAELNIKNNYGKIDIINYTPIGRKNYIRALHAPIYITIDKILTEQLVVNNRFEDIEIFVPTDISAEISLAVEEDSKIEVSDILFTPGLIQENRLNLTVGEGETILSSHIRGKGSIYIKGRTEGES
jgi:hypothetical protein